MKHATGLDLKLKNEMSEISRMADSIEAWGKGRGLPASVVHDLSVAVDDIVTNIINYAFPRKERHEIQVKLGQEKDVVTCVIIDDGAEFDPLKAPPPDISKTVEERDIGGLGIFLAKSLMDRIDYQRKDGRNVLTLCKNL